MTVFLRALWGPFGRDTNALRRDGIIVVPATEVNWYFFGIREDDTMGRWCLRWKVSERKFTAFALEMPPKAADPAFANAFVPDQPMIYGRTYLHILKSRLSPADLAMATALSIQGSKQ